MKIAIGSDHVGYELKEILRQYLVEQHIVPVEVVDKGVHDKNPVDYPDIAILVAKAIASGECERGVLVCGTGIGMAITANKVPGVRAAQAHDHYSAERARMSNDAQIITMGSLVIGPELAKSLIAVWLPAEFQGGRSTPKVDKIKAIDREYHSA